MGDLLADVRVRLDESTAFAWTNESLRGWINDGARELARKTESLMTKSTIAVTAGTRSYTMPTSMVKAHRVEYIATGDSQIHPLEGRDYSAADNIWGLSQAISSGTPYIFALWGFPPSLTIYLYPTPAVNGTLNVFHYRLPTDRATDGTGDALAVEVPEGWADLITDYVEYRAKRRDNDPDWQAAKAIYDEHVLDMYATTRRWTDDVGLVTNSQGLGIPDWLYQEGY